MRTPGWFRQGGWRLVTATLLVAGAVAIALVIVVPGGGSTPATSNPAAVAKGIAAKLNCKEVDYVYDDMYFYDTMHGVNCYDQENEVTVIRAYKHPESVPVVLRNWKPLITSKRLLVTGDGWFAVGPKRILSVIAKEVEGASDVTARVPAMDNAKPAKKHQAETKCVSFVTGALVARALHPDKYAEQAPDLNKAYPGLADVVESSLSDKDIATLKKFKSESDSFKFEAYLSRFGSPVKDFCRSHPWSSKPESTS